MANSHSTSSSSLSVPRTRLWVIRDSRYLKLCADAVGGRNVGIIDRDGWISAKRGPVSIIRRESSFTPSGPKGYSRADSGTGFIGWANFGSVEGALAWLRGKFDLGGA